MKRKRFSVEQIVAVVKEAEGGAPVAELIRKVGISEQTFYRWKKVYGGLEDGFEWRGKRWRSLTEVAQAISGAHWSGPRFFGLIGKARATSEEASRG